MLRITKQISERGGSAVRRLAAQPQEAPKEARPLKSGVSSQTRRNRARATQISAGYAVFLAIVCTLCIAACVAYVKLQTVGYHAGGRHYQQRKRIERSEGGQ